MACLLQRITSMKLQNNWYVWQINLDLSSSCLVAHKARVQVSTYLDSCHGLCFLPRLPSCFYPFLFNCVPPSGFWFSSSSFSFWCLSQCYVVVSLFWIGPVVVYHVQSSSIYADSPLY